MIEFKEFAGDTEMGKKAFTVEGRHSGRAVGTYPASRDIQREITPDWILYITLVLLALSAWLRMAYSKYIAATFSSVVNYQLTLKLYNENSLLQKRISFLLHLVYFISGGIYLYLLLEYFNWHPFGYTGLNLFYILAAFLAAMEAYRIIIMKVTGYLFVRQDLFSRYLFHFYLTNKVLGLVFIPFILAIAYTKGAIHDVVIYSSLVVVAAAYLLRFIRSVLFVIKNVVLIFYLILYLCALEILPFLVVIKLVLSLA